jgi:putative transposase
MSFELIEAEKGHYPKALMCRALGLSRSGHHAFSTREPSKRALERQRLDVLVAAIFAELEGRYGAPRIEKELRRRGHRTSRKRVAASMVLQGLVARPRRRLEAYDGLLAPGAHRAQPARQELHRRGARPRLGR